MRFSDIEGVTRRLPSRPGADSGKHLPMASSVLLPAHSHAEACVYVMLQTCGACDSGIQEVAGEELEEEHIDNIIRLNCACPECGEKTAYRFRIDSRWAAARELPLINPTEEPSKLIDVAQWLTLYHTVLARSREASDRTASRREAFQAALCIAEALKFYEPDNDLPPASAFFSDQAREQARAHPAFFARDKLLSLQSGLPDLRATQAVTNAKSARKWWKFWQKPRCGADPAGPDSV